MLTLSIGYGLFLTIFRGGNPTVIFLSDSIGKKDFEKQRVRKVKLPRHYGHLPCLRSDAVPNLLIRNQLSINQLIDH